MKKLSRLFFQICACAVLAAAAIADSRAQAPVDSTRLAELARMVAAHPALGAAPLPAFARMHQISVSETKFTTDPYPSAHAVSSARVLIGGTHGSLVDARMDSLGSYIQTTQAGTSSARFTETDRRTTSAGLSTLGGLVGLESSSTTVDRAPGGLNMTVTGRVDSINSVEGNLFPLANGNRFKIRLTNTVASSLSASRPVTWDVEQEYVVLERQDVYEAEGLRIDGGVFKIEEVSRRKGRGNSGLAIESRQVKYYAEKYQWTVAWESGMRTSTSSSTTRSMPVLLIGTEGIESLTADLERFDRDLGAVHKATADSYLAPRRAALVALVPGGANRPSQSATCQSAGDSVWQALISAGFKHIAERSGNLYARTGAGVAGLMLKGC